MKMSKIQRIFPGTVYELPDCMLVELSCEHTAVDILPSNDGRITLWSSSRKLMAIHDTVGRSVEIAEAEDPIGAVVIGGGAVAIGPGAVAVGNGGVAVRGSNYGSINVPSAQATILSESVATLRLPQGVGYVVSSL
jgi:hypothetical protein